MEEEEASSIANDEDFMVVEDDDDEDIDEFILSDQMSGCSDEGGIEGSGFESADGNDVADLVFSHQQQQQQRLLVDSPLSSPPPISSFAPPTQFPKNNHTSNQSTLQLFEYSCLSRLEVSNLKSLDVSHVAELCGINASLASLLLQSQQWNKERLLERYMEDPERICSQAGILYSEIDSSHSSDASTTGRLIVEQASADFTCPICCVDVEDEPVGLKQVCLAACRHQFCLGCMTYYLVQKIRSEGQVRQLTCPQSGCKNPFDKDSIRTLLHSPQNETGIWEKYEMLSLKAYVDDVDWLKWCPAPGCDNIVRCDVRSSQLSHLVPTVQCNCGRQFCFGCQLGESHEPCLCHLAKMWVKKNEDESETGNWIAAHTKECTKCHYVIEKNGGCNHMTCKNCRYEFCWVCLGPWTEHGTTYYNCNRYDEKSSKEARETQAESRRQLERYLHYFNRYNNHVQSIKLATEFYSRTERKMEDMQRTSLFSWIDVQFIKRGLQVVNECRAVLKWTYAFAYYLKNNNMSVLFEDNQRDLEVAVESLNELIEQPLPDTDDPTVQQRKLAELKQLCLDKTEYCARRRRVVVEDTARGLQEDRWSFSVKLQ